MAYWIDELLSMEIFALAVRPNKMINNGLNECSFLNLSTRSFLTATFFENQDSTIEILHLKLRLNGGNDGENHQYYKDNQHLRHFILWAFGPSFPNRDVDRLMN